MAQRDWWSDFEHEYALAVGDETARASDTAYTLVTQGLGSVTPDLVHRLATPDDAVAEVLLVMTEDDLAHVVTLTEAGSRVRFLGSLAGGTYTEDIRLKSAQFLVEMTFHHDRLGDQPLHVSLRLLHDDSSLSPLGASRGLASPEASRDVSALGG